MLSEIQNTELTRLINKLVGHTKSFINYEVETISSDREYKDGVFTLATDKIRLWGFVPNKCSILIDYTVKYNFGISKDYEHILSGSIFTQDENNRILSTPIPNDVDNINALIRYFQTTFK
jgi:hypothetical protein